MTARIDVYTEKRGLIRRRTQYRWRVIAANGRIMATGAEGYNNLADLQRGVVSVAAALVIAVNHPVPIRMPGD